MRRKFEPLTQVDIFKFVVFGEVKFDEATLLPPKIREAVTDRDFRAICSALCGAS